jgi:transposase
MAKKRKVHSPAFKAQVALAAHKGDRTINELAGHHGVHPTLIHGWKKHLLAGAEGLFAGPAAAHAASADAEARQAELFEPIGRLKMELVAPQGTVVTSGPARLSEIARTAVLAASGPPRAARGLAGPAAHASSIDGPSVPPPSPASGPAT